MQTLVLATTNRYKVEEIRRALVGFNVLSRPASLGQVVETEETFEGNALVKAIAVAQGTTAISLADDSGVVVAALDGAPGVHSARFAGEEATDLDNVEKLLRLMDGVQDRSAYFVCVLVLCRPDGKWLSFEGRVDGRISMEAVGANGFGYDPIFIPSDGDGRSFGEFSLDEKNHISHRAVAIRKMVEFVNSPEGLEFFHL